MNETEKTEIEDFRQKYAWVSLQLLVTNAVIEPVLVHFRMRKVKEEGEGGEGEDDVNE